MRCELCGKIETLWPITTLIVKQNYDIYHTICHCGEPEDEEELYECEDDFTYYR